MRININISKPVFYAIEIIKCQIPTYGGYTAMEDKKSFFSETTKLLLPKSMEESKAAKAIVGAAVRMGGDVYANCFGCGCRCRCHKSYRQTANAFNPEYNPRLEKGSFRLLKLSSISVAIAFN